jgi:chromosome segregation ATPase
MLRVLVQKADGTIGVCEMPDWSERLSRVETDLADMNRDHESLMRLIGETGTKLFETRMQLLEMQASIDGLQEASMAVNAAAGEINERFERMSDAMTHAESLHGTVKVLLNSVAAHKAHAEVRFAELLASDIGGMRTRLEHVEKAQSEAGRRA